MRALLIANPYATSTTAVRREVITRALASELDLNVVQTRYRGTPGTSRRAPPADGYELVLTLGGDGTVNEVVNGMLRASPPAAAQAAASPPSAAPPPGTPVRRARPAALPGGSANVFTRALGLPADLVDATGQILGALQERRTRSIGLGLAGSATSAPTRAWAWTPRSCGWWRACGRAGAGPPRRCTCWTAVRQFCAVTNRRVPALRLERDGVPAAGRAVPRHRVQFLAVDLPGPAAGPRQPPGRLRHRPGPARRPQARHAPHAQHGAADAGPRRRAVRGRHVVSLHDQPALTFRAARPVAFQVDGEYVGEREHVMLRSIPNALRVLA